MSTMIKRSLGILALLVSFSVAGSYFKPSHLMADTRPAARIETVASQDFGGWRLLENGGLVVNPQSNALIERIYTETVNRRFVDAQGNVVMLAIAYGRDQSDALQVHEPWVCYPAQGFALSAHVRGALETPWGNIPVQRIVATHGARIVPVTYWMTLGDRVVDGSALAKKRIKFDYSLQGLIPDGLLFRVSTIDADSAHAFEVQDRFVREYLAQLSPSWRLRLSGL